MLEGRDAASFAAGEICRVGGLALTQRAIELCGLAPGAYLADIGCGQGATVRYLRRAGFIACGLDSDPAAIALAGEYCRQGDALALPFAKGSLDGVLFECSLSVINAKEQALAEARRTLKAGGKLIVSDLYDTRENVWPKLLEQAGFSVTLFEDRRQDLKEYAAQLVWQYGREALPKYDKSADMSYFLLTAEIDR